MGIGQSCLVPAASLKSVEQRRFEAFIVVRDGTLSSDRVAQERLDVDDSVESLLLH